MNSTPQSRNDEEFVMSETTQARNKALVLEAFDILFNNRDYEAADGTGRPIRSSTAPDRRLLSSIKKQPAAHQQPGHTPQDTCGHLSEPSRRDTDITP